MFASLAACKKDRALKKDTKTSERSASLAQAEFKEASILPFYEQFQFPFTPPPSGTGLPGETIIKVWKVAENTKGHWSVFSEEEFNIVFTDGYYRFHQVRHLRSFLQTHSLHSEISKLTWLEGLVNVRAGVLSAGIDVRGDLLYDGFPLVTVNNTGSFGINR